jgi:hypothetical protein
MEPRLSIIPLGVPARRLHLAGRGRRRGARAGQVCHGPGIGSRAAAAGRRVPRHTELSFRVRLARRRAYYIESVWRGSS